MTSRKRTRTTEDDPNILGTQDNSVEDLAKKCIRFILGKMGSNMPFKRLDIVKHVFMEKPGKMYDVVMKRVAADLKNIYGLNIDICDTQVSNKNYFIINNLPHVSILPNSYDYDYKMTLTYLILAHIFMSKKSSTDIELWKFLQVFNIDTKTVCPIIGNFKNFIEQTLVKQQFVICEERGGEHDGGDKKKTFRWGSRAEQYISKMDILTFTSTLFENQDIQFWNDQYNDAKIQFPQEDLDNTENSK